jgi:antitoxin FitA
MASITIPNVDHDLKQRLIELAVERGHSMEVEAREILEDALARKQPTAVLDNLYDAILYDAIRAIVEPLGGFELAPFPRQPLREPPKLD